jgi:hypothetical protein
MLREKPPVAFFCSAEFATMSDRASENLQDIDTRDRVSVREFAPNQESRMPKNLPTPVPGPARFQGLGSYRRVAFRLLCYGFLGWTLASQGSTSWKPPDATGQGSLSWHFAAFLFTLVVATAVHELGHLVASRLVGFRPVLISVSLLALRRGPSGWRFGIGRGLGQCLAYATDARDLRRRHLVYFGGGVVAGFAFAAISGLVRWTGIVPPGPLDGLLAYCFWVGLVLNTLSLVPNGVGSDGFCLGVMRSPGPSCDQFIAAFTCQLLDLAGKRYRDVDPVLVAALALPTCSTTWRIIGQNTAYFIAAEAGRVAEARARLHELWELTTGQPGHPNVELELAYFVAVHEKDAGEARRHFEAAQGRGSPIARHLAEAAILIEEGRPAAAKSVLNQAGPIVAFLAKRGTGMAQHISDEFNALAVRAEEGESPD